MGARLLQGRSLPKDSRFLSKENLASRRRKGRASPKLRGAVGVLRGTTEPHIMARRKRTSTSAAFAQSRANSLGSIDPNLDLGNGMTLAAYALAIKGTADKNDAYNTELSKLDGLLNDLEAGEAALDDLSTRMLAAVGVKYGKDSSEYEKAGGTRTSERKPPTRKAKAAKP